MKTDVTNTLIKFWGTQNNGRQEQRDGTVKEAGEAYDLP